MTDALEVNVDELGPVDFLIIEFPADAQNFTGEMAAELVRLSEAGTIRVLDVLVIQKNDDGSIDALELDEAPGLDDLRALEADLAEILAVTSENASQGRSTVSLCLARSAAKSGLRVALVDADLHHPDLAERLLSLIHI